MLHGRSIEFSTLHSTPTRSALFLLSSPRALQKGLGFNIPGLILFSEPLVSPPSQSV